MWHGLISEKHMMVTHNYRAALKKYAKLDGFVLWEEQSREN